MAIASPHYRMANQLVDGRLDEILTALQAEKLSYSSISSRLFAEHGIEVTPPTIGKWLNGLKVAAS